MAEKISKGTRVLFVAHPGGPVKEGVVMAYAPSGNYIGLETFEGDREWFAVNSFGVVETLQDAPVRREPIVAVERQQQQQQQQEPPKGAGALPPTPNAEGENPPAANDGQVPKEIVANN